MEKKRKKKRRRDHLEFLLTHNDNLAIDTCLVRTWSEGNSNSNSCTWSETYTNTFIKGTEAYIVIYIRVAELGSLSSGAKMAVKIFVKRIFTIFATKASFLRVIVNLQI